MLLTKVEKSCTKNLRKIVRKKIPESPEIRSVLHFQRPKKVSIQCLMSIQSVSIHSVMDCTICFIRYKLYQNSVCSYLVLNSYSEASRHRGKNNFAGLNHFKHFVSK